LFDLGDVKMWDLIEGVWVYMVCFSVWIDGCFLKLLHPSLIWIYNIQVTVRSLCYFTYYK
jgi:hypothetical protein